MPQITGIPRLMHHDPEMNLSMVAVDAYESDLNFSLVDLQQGKIIRRFSFLTEPTYRGRKNGIEKGVTSSDFSRFLGVSNHEFALFDLRTGKKTSAIMVGNAREGVDWHQINSDATRVAFMPYESDGLLIYDLQNKKFVLDDPHFFKDKVHSYYRLSQFPLKMDAKLEKFIYALNDGTGRVRIMSLLNQSASDGSWPVFEEAPKKNLLSRLWSPDFWRRSSEKALVQKSTQPLPYSLIEEIVLPLELRQDFISAGSMVVSEDWNQIVFHTRTHIGLYDRNLKKFRFVYQRRSDWTHLSKDYQRIYEKREGQTAIFDLPSSEQEGDFERVLSFSREGIYLDGSVEVSPKMKHAVFTEKVKAFQHWYRMAYLKLEKDAVPEEFPFRVNVGQKVIFSEDESQILLLEGGDQDAGKFRVIDLATRNIYEGDFLDDATRARGGSFYSVTQWLSEEGVLLVSSSTRGMVRIKYSLQ